MPFDSKNAWMRSLSCRSRGSAAHHSQSTAQFAAVRQASGPNVAAERLDEFVTGVPSKFAYSGASPVLRFVVAWKKSRQPYRASYSTPILVERKGHDAEVLIASTQGVSGYDPATGDERFIVQQFSYRPLVRVDLVHNFACVGNGHLDLPRGFFEIGHRPIGRVVQCVFRDELADSALAVGDVAGY